LTNSKIALSVALILATASAAVAAPKLVRHQPTIAEQVPGTYPGIASVHAPASGKISWTDPDRAWKPINASF
jgi:hypothetical protein